MAAYVIERDRWPDKDELLPLVRPLTEEEVKQWLRNNDWRWYLVDDEARAQLQHLAIGIRDVQKKELLSKPDVTSGDEVLLIGYVSPATADPKKPGKAVRRRWPEWVYKIYRRGKKLRDHNLRGA